MHMDPGFHCLASGCHLARCCVWNVCPPEVMCWNYNLQSQTLTVLWSVVFWGGDWVGGFCSWNDSSVCGFMFYQGCGFVRKASCLWHAGCIRPCDHLGHPGTQPWVLDLGLRASRMIRSRFTQSWVFLLSVYLFFNLFERQRETASFH